MSKVQRTGSNWRQPRHTGALHRRCCTGQLSAAIVVIAISLNTVAATAPAAVTSQDSGKDFGWRVYLHHYDVQGSAQTHGDLGGLVLAHTGDVATVEPAGVFRFPCESTLTAAELADVNALLPTLLEGIDGLEDFVGIFPGRESSMFTRLNDRDSPYTELVLVIESWGRGEDRNSHRRYLKYADVESVRASKPHLGALIALALGIQTRLDPRCAHDALAQKK